VDKRITGKSKLYIAFVFAAGLAVPLVSQLRGWMSEDTMDLVRGILIGLAIVFLAAGARTVTKSTSRSQT
jgi:hypothetical protein